MLKGLLAEGSSERKLFLFILKLFLIWFSWKAILFVLGHENHPIEERLFPTLSTYWEALNESLALFILNRSKNALEMFGYTTYLNHRIIWIANTNGVGMGNYCIGIQLIYYFVMLILITPISTVRKITSIPAGIAITFLLNIVRIMSLCLISLYMPEYIEYAHDHIFNIVVFGTLMGFYYFLTKER